MSPPDVSQETDFDAESFGQLLDLVSLFFQFAIRFIVSLVVFAGTFQQLAELFDLFRCDSW